jgi:ATP-dependent Clp protease ATP-binding subunit ClpA
MKEGIMEKVQKIFSPELMNRIDESIVFHSLTEQNVYDIIDLQLSDLIQNLSKLDLSLKLTKTAKKLLAKSGYDPKYGVRLLRREIQRLLEDPISETMLKQGLPKGTVITVKAIRKSLHFTYKSKKLTKRIKPKLPSK